jgi:hypothetical protein
MVYKLFGALLLKNSKSKFFLASMKYLPILKKPSIGVAILFRDTAVAVLTLKMHIGSRL